MIVCKFFFEWVDSQTFSPKQNAIRHARPEGAGTTLAMVMKSQVWLGTGERTQMFGRCWPEWMSGGTPLSIIMALVTLAQANASA